MTYDELVIGLTPMDRDRLDGWHSAAKTLGPLEAIVIGGPARPTGWWVSANLSRECRLKTTGFRKQLETLGPDGPFGNAYSSQISQFRNLRPRARRPAGDPILRRLVLGSNVLQAAFALEMTLSRPGGSDPLDEWLTFLEAWDTRKELQEEVLARSLGGDPCWAFVPHPLAFELPEHGRDWTRLYERLALKWTAVEERRQNPSTPLPVALLLEYRWDDVRAVGVPTIADVEWYARFAPSPARAKFGRTIDRRGDPENATSTGLNEVVHAKPDDWSSMLNHPFNTFGQLQQ